MPKLSQYISPIKKKQDVLASKVRGSIGVPGRALRHLRLSIGRDPGSGACAGPDTATARGGERDKYKSRMPETRRGLREEVGVLLGAVCLLEGRGRATGAPRTSPGPCSAIFLRPHRGSLPRDGAPRPPSMRDHAQGEPARR